MTNSLKTILATSSEPQLSRSILITGINGFLGGHLVEFSRQRGAEISGLGHGHLAESDLERSGISHFRNGEVDFINLQSLSEQAGGFDVVFHLAGGSSVGKSFLEPAEDRHRTIDSGAALLEWVRLSSPRTAVVFASSAAVYGEGHEGPIRERDRVSPFSPYGTHKAMLELLFQSYAKNFGISLAVVRFFSVYGERLRKQLIFDTCRRLADKPEQINLGGHGNELRDWMYASDAARLLWHMSSRCNSNCPTINGSSGCPLTVREVVSTLVAKWGRDCEICFSGERRPGDPISLVADTRELRRSGFEPATDWQSGIDRVVTWYQQAFSNDD